MCADSGNLLALFRLRVASSKRLLLPRGLWKYRSPQARPQRARSNSETTRCILKSQFGYKPSLRSLCRKNEELADVREVFMSLEGVASSVPKWARPAFAHIWSFSAEADHDHKRRSGLLGGVLSRRASNADLCISGDLSSRERRKTCRCCCHFVWRSYCYLPPWETSTCTPRAAPTTG